MLDYERDRKDISYVQNGQKTMVKTWFLCSSHPSHKESKHHIYIYTIWLFNIAMENGPFIDGLPIKNGDFPWLC